MNVHGLTWEGCRPGVSEAVLNAVEQQLGVKFPAEYRQLVLTCQGGAPVERAQFYFMDPRRKMRIGNELGAMLTIDPDDDMSITRTLEGLSYDDQIPAGVIPFAEDGGGDMMCFDFRTRPDAPTVCYWAHERVKDESVIPLADSFADFLAMLAPIPDYDSPNTP